MVVKAVGLEKLGRGGCIEKKFQKSEIGFLVSTTAW